MESVLYSTNSSFEKAIIKKKTLKAMSKKPV